MRKMISTLATVALFACGGGGVAGEYTLVSIDGNSLPAPYIAIDTTWVESLVLELTADGSFSYTAVTSEESTTATGTYTIGDDGTLHFVPSDESDSDPFDGALEGDELTAESQDRIFVFHR